MPDGTCRTLKTSHAGLAKFRRQDAFGYTGILVINETDTDKCMLRQHHIHSDNANECGRSK